VVVVVVVKLLDKDKYSIQFFKKKVEFYGTIERCFLRGPQSSSVRTGERYQMSRHHKGSFVQWSSVPRVTAVARRAFSQPPHLRCTNAPHFLLLWKCGRNVISKVEERKPAGKLFKTQESCGNTERNSRERGRS